MSGALEGYLRDLETGGEADRVYAAEDLGSLNSSEAACALAAHLKRESSPQVKEAVFHALHAIADPAVMDCAIGLFTHDDPFVRNRAVELLRARQSEAVGRLAAALDSADADLRKLSVDALSGLDSPQATELYAAALHDADPNVVITAVEAVGRSRRMELMPAVIALFQTAEHPMLVGACLETLALAGDAQALRAADEKFGAEGPPGFLAPAYLRLYGRASEEPDPEKLAEYLRRPEPGVCAAALDCLLHLSSRGRPVHASESLKAGLCFAAAHGSTPALRDEAERAWAVLAHGDE